MTASAAFSGPRARCLELLGHHQTATSQHCVQFYEQDSFVVKNICYFAARALEAGDSAVLIATPSHRRAIEDGLAGWALDLDRLREIGRYVALDAAETLQRFLTDGYLDKAKFDAVVETAIHAAIKCSSNGFVFAFGEMVALLCAAKKLDLAVRLERFWNALVHKHHFALCCAYSLESFGATPDLNAVSRICAEHSIVIPAETLL